ncbi:hypothetical protein KZZ07_04555 [Mameliella sp. CS4]|uniref:hypothetical protein n=1 Tax=Mameliella sp. CS4 TaxID=2862329 RepID=UPI001C603A0B|nr:hypothetical protein [Mameliella sp. CS4]MBW4981808.1 hypothetical protein [Mameliella sp. CS4]
MKIRVSINGTWTADQFSEFFAGMQSLANWFSTDYLVDDDGSVILVNDDQPLVVNIGDPTLSVSAIVFQSPGATDFTGLGKIVEQVRLFVQFLLERSERRNISEIEVEEKRVRLQTEKLRLISEAAQLLEQYPKMRDLLQTSGPDGILEAIVEKRITSIEEVED